MIDLQLRWHSHGRRGEKSKDKDERLHFGYGNMRIVSSFMILYIVIEKELSEEWRVIHGHSQLFILEFCSIIRRH